MDGGAWWATVHGVAKSQTRLSDFTFTFTFKGVGEFKKLTVKEKRWSRVQNMQMRPKALVQELKAGRKTEEPGQTGKEGRTREGFSVRGRKSFLLEKSRHSGPRWESGLEAGVAPPGK